MVPVKFCIKLSQLCQGIAWFHNFRFDTVWRDVSNESLELARKGSLCSGVLGYKCKLLEFADNYKLVKATNLHSTKYHCFWNLVWWLSEQTESIIFIYTVMSGNCYGALSTIAKSSFQCVAQQCKGKTELPASDTCVLRSSSRWIMKLTKKILREMEQLPHQQLAHLSTEHHEQKEDCSFEFLQVWTSFNCSH